MTVDAGLIIFRCHLHLTRRFRMLLRMIHRVVVMAGAAGCRVVFFHSRPFTLGKFRAFGFEFFRCINRVGNKGLVDIVARFQFALHHAWNIRRDMTVMAFSSHAGGVLEMHRLFIFFIHRLHTVATDTKFGCAGDFDPNVWQYNQRNANHNPNSDQRQYRPTSTGSA